jgi:flavin reductase (DIM6/NTAB) family NADH-FMN oxidoreductase RutF
MDAGPQIFDKVVADLDTPMYVVSTAVGDDRAGCLVAFASRCSLDPPRFAVWLSKLNRTYQVALSAKALAINVLRAGDQDLAEHFGAQTGDEVDKFQDLDWSLGPGGCPVLARCDWFAGPIANRFDAGDHVAFVIAPQAASARRFGTPFLGTRGAADVPAGHPIAEG